MNVNRKNTKNDAENSDAHALDKDDHLDMYIKKILQN